MPELPDITVYIEALESRVVGQPLESVRVESPFLLRSFDPPLEETFGRQVVEVRRLGKRIAFGLEGELWLVLHLMIAGRLQWKEPGAKTHIAKIPGGKSGLAAFDFPHGMLILTEAGSRKRASLHVVREGGLDAHQPGVAGKPGGQVWQTAPKTSWKPIPSPASSVIVAPVSGVLSWLLTWIR